MSRRVGASEQGQLQGANGSHPGPRQHGRARASSRSRFPSPSAARATGICRARRSCSRRRCCGVRRDRLAGDAAALITPAAGNPAVCRRDSRKAARSPGNDGRHSSTILAATVSGCLQRVRILAGHGAGAHARAGRAGIEQIDPHVGRSRSRPHRCAPACRARPWRPRRAPNRRAAVDATPDVTNTTRPASATAQQRVEGADEPPVGGDVDGDRLVPVLRLDMVERRQRAENAGIADEDVEPAVALVERRRRGGRCRR